MTDGLRARGPRWPRGRWWLSMMLGGVAGALVVLVCPTWLGVVVVVATAVFVIVDAIILARRLGAMELRPDDSEDDA